MSEAQNALKFQSRTREEKRNGDTKTLRTEGMEQSIMEVRELKNRDGQVGIGRERKGLGEAVKEKGRRRGGGAPLPPRSKRELLKKSVPPAPAAAPQPIQTHYSEKAHSLMASVVGSPRRGPGTASPDAHGNTAESFSKKSFAVGLRSGEGESGGGGGEWVADARGLPSGNSSHPIVLSLRRSRCTRLGCPDG